MNYKKHISNGYRIVIPVLLAYFLFSHLFVSLNRNNCTNECSVNKCKVTEMKMHAKCCCGTEYSEQKKVRKKNPACENFSLCDCSVSKSVNLFDEFVLVKNFQLEKEFYVITFLREIPRKVEFNAYYSSKIIINENSPPVYLAVQSFLI